MSTLGVPDVNQALADTLLPLQVNAGRPVRLACDDQAFAAAGRTLGLSSHETLPAVLALLREHGLLSATDGLLPLARRPAVAGDVPVYLTGLALLVLAASRMVSDEQASMNAYYVRLGELLDVPLRDIWPHILGVPELVGRFAELGQWLHTDQQDARGILDLPAATRYVDTPIAQTLLRAGDRGLLGAFFQRHGPLIDAGWDAAQLLRRWGGRHHLSHPLQQLLDRDDLRAALTGALRAAWRTWDGVIVDEHGQRVLPGVLTVHLRPGQIILALDVPALETPGAFTGPDGQQIMLRPNASTALPAAWLTAASDGPVTLLGADHTRVRALDGPVMLFEIGQMGQLTPVTFAAETPVWVLTDDVHLISVCDQARQSRASLPGTWTLLCDVDPALLPDELRQHAAAPEEALHGILTVGGLPLKHDVWLLDHPPAFLSDLPEPAPVSIDERTAGDLEPGQLLSLEGIAHDAGVHTVQIADQELRVELAARGLRKDVGSLAFSADPQRIHAGPTRAGADEQPRICGPLVSGGDVRWEPPLLVRYKANVSVIEVDGSIRQLAPPPPAPWLEHVGLGAPVAWEIPDPSRVVWLAVDAASGKLAICRLAVDVPVTDDVLDVIDWFRDAKVVDRADGRAPARWARLVDAYDQSENVHA